MVLDISGVFFFMPVFSFLFVFLITYAILAKTQILGEMNWINVFVSFILAIVFMSFSSAELYVRTVIPWFVVLVIAVFFILIIAGFTKNLDTIMKPWFAWLIIIVLGIVFLVAAINVFNPVFHPDLIITGAESGPGVVEQFKDFISSSRVAGSFILLIVAGIVAWVVTKK